MEGTEGFQWLERPLLGTPIWAKSGKEFHPAIVQRHSNDPKMLIIQWSSTGFKERVPCRSDMIQTFTSYRNGNRRSSANMVSDETAVVQPRRNRLSLSRKLPTAVAPPAIQSTLRVQPGNAVSPAVVKSRQSIVEQEETGECCRSDAESASQGKTCNSVDVSSSSVLGAKVTEAELTTSQLAGCDGGSMSEVNEPVRKKQRLKQEDERQHDSDSDVEFVHESRSTATSPQSHVTSPCSHAVENTEMEAIDLTGDDVDDEDETVVGGRGDRVYLWSNVLQQAADEDIGEFGTDERSAYLRHFEEAIVATLVTRSDYASLFLPREHALAQKFFSLPRDARTLFVRLQGRKRTWLRVDSMLKYLVKWVPPDNRKNASKLTEDSMQDEVEEGESPIDEEDSQDSGDGDRLAKEYVNVLRALQQLKDAGFVRPFPTGDTGSAEEMDILLDVAKQCLKSEELKSVLKKAPRHSKSKRPPGMSQIDQLRQCWKGQGTLWGKLPLAGHMRDELRKSLHQKFGSSGSGSNQQLVPQECEEGITLCAMVCDEPRQLFQRILRLLYSSCSTGAVSRGAVGSNTYGGTGSVGMPGLLVAFGKRTYTSYKINVTSPPFRDRASYLEWESAIVLRTRLDDASQSQSSTSEDGLSQAIEAVMEAAYRLYTLGVSNKGGCIPPPEELHGLSDKVKSSTPISPDNVSNMLTTIEKWTTPSSDILAESMTSIAHENVKTRTGTGVYSHAQERADVCMDVSSDSGSHVVAQTSIHTNMNTEASHICTMNTTDDLDMNDGEYTNTPVHMNMNTDGSSMYTTSSAKTTVTTNSTTCDVDVNARECTNMSVGMSINTEASSMYTTTTNAKSSDVMSHQPAFLLQLSGGWVLSSVLWEGVALLESAKEYSAAVQLIGQLLTVPFASHRRGRYYERLTKDLVHMGYKRQALRACTIGLADGYVRAGARAYLKRQEHRLKRQLKLPIPRTKTCDIDLEEGALPFGDLTSESIGPELSSDPHVRKLVKAVCAAGVQYMTVVIRAKRLATNIGGDGASPGDKGKGKAGVKTVIGKKCRYIGYGEGEPCGVEELVSQHYALAENGGWIGFHSEGCEVRALFSLFMWDIIFADVPDVFQGPFQDAPLDMDCPPLFFAHRREAITSRLSQISAATPRELAQEVASSWNMHYGQTARFIRWSAISLHQLQATAVGIGGLGLAGVFTGLCLDSRHLSGGMPDLLLLRATKLPQINESSTMHTEYISESQEDNVMTLKEWIEGEGEQGTEDFGAVVADMGIQAMLLEVKSPNDRLSDTQRAWLNILKACNIHSGECRVTERDSSESEEESSSQENSDED